MGFSERRTKLRRILEGDRVVYPSPVHDPISARIGELLEFEVGLVAGSTAAVTELCTPGMTQLLTATEGARLVRRMTRAASLSLVVVAENGYGNALNVRRTVEDLEAAGAAAIVLDDSKLPASFGSAMEDELISAAEAFGKLKAAIAARQDPGLVIVGRTMGLKADNDGIATACRQAAAFERAGADAVFLSGASTRTEIAAVHAATTLPLIISHSSREVADPAFLAANGVRIASAGHLSLWASVQAMYDTLKALKEGQTQSQLRPSVASPELMAEVTRQAQYDDWIRRYLN